MTSKLIPVGRCEQCQWTRDGWMVYAGAGWYQTDRRHEGTVTVGTWLVVDASTGLVRPAPVEAATHLAPVPLEAEMHGPERVTVKDLRVGDVFQGTDHRTPMRLVSPRQGSLAARAVAADQACGRGLPYWDSERVEVISRADQFESGARAAGAAVGRMFATRSPAPRCPSCDSAAHLRRTDHGWYCGGTCGGWHGKTLTAPPPAPRFAVGQWVRGNALARTKSTGPLFKFATWQVVTVVHGGRVEPWNYDIAIEEHTEECRGTWTTRVDERLLEACEAPQ